MLNLEDKINTLMKEAEDNLKGIEELSDSLKAQINNKQRIVIVGLGMSASIAKTAISEIYRYKIDPKLFEIVFGTSVFTNGENEFSNLEDVREAAIFEMDSINLNKNDLVIGITASGKTKYISYVLAYAHNIGCKTSIISPNSTTKITENLDLDIIIDTDKYDSNSINVSYVSEITLLKMIMDVLLIKTMEKMGRIWKGIFVNTKMTSSKIQNSVVKWLETEYDISVEDALDLIEQYDKSLPHIIIHLETNLSKEEIHFIINNNDLNIKDIINNHK